jgi:hypothetical protein
VPCRSFYKWDSLSDEKLSLLVFNIGMVELVSYWKSVCSPTIVVKPYSLTSEQIKFWKKLYFNGLSEFFYLNGINASKEDFVLIQSDSDKTLAKATFDNDDSFIVPIGGGKDSVVTLELLSQAGKDICPMIINPRGATTECAAIAGYDREAFIEMLAIPVQVLFDKFGYRQIRLDRFTHSCLNYLEMVQDGTVTLAELRKTLQDEAGIVIQPISKKRK